MRVFNFDFAFAGKLRVSEAGVHLPSEGVPVLASFDQSAPSIGWAKLSKVEGGIEADVAITPGTFTFLPEAGPSPRLFPAVCLRCDDLVAGVYGRSVLESLCLSAAPNADHRIESVSMLGLLFERGNG